MMSGCAIELKKSSEETTDEGDHEPFLTTFSLLTPRAGGSMIATVLDTVSPRFDESGVEAELESFYVNFTCK